MTGWLRSVPGALLIAFTAVAAYLAGQLATRRKRQALDERRLAASVTAGTRAALEAKARADRLESEAQAAQERARQRVDKLARADATLEQVVNDWNREAQ